MLILRKQQYRIHLEMEFLKVVLLGKVRDKSKYNNRFNNQIMYFSGKKNR